MALRALKQRMSNFGAAGMLVVSTLAAAAVQAQDQTRPAADGGLILVDQYASGNYANRKFHQFKQGEDTGPGWELMSDRTFFAYEDESSPSPDGTTLKPIYRYKARGSWGTKTMLGGEEHSAATGGWQRESEPYFYLLEITETKDGNAQLAPIWPYSHSFESTYYGEFYSYKETAGTGWRKAEEPLGYTVPLDVKWSIESATFTHGEPEKSSEPETAALIRDVKYISNEAVKSSLKSTFTQTRKETKTFSFGFDQRLSLGFEYTAGMDLQVASSSVTMTASVEVAANQQWTEGVEVTYHFAEERTIQDPGYWVFAHEFLEYRDTRMPFNASIHLSATRNGTAITGTELKNLFLAANPEIKAAQVTIVGDDHQDRINVDRTGVIRGDVATEQHSFLMRAEEYCKQFYASEVANCMAEVKR